ncbi:MAG: hypothetical protein F6K41_44965 [Symploca sp. SIO3E6]|nr:hypothetical protein [Caldora sp. SIO3E6]
MSTPLSYQIRYRYIRYAHIVETFHETSQSKISRFAQNGSIVTGFGISWLRSHSDTSTR